MKMHPLITRKVIAGSLEEEVIPLGLQESGKWKLYANPYDTSRREYTYPEKFVLFDLENDPGESVNLYDQKPNVVYELKSLYKAWKNKQ